MADRFRIAQEDSVVFVITNCPFCSAENPPVVVDKGEWDKYQAGNLAAIQLTGNVDTAEYLISGICIKCWDRTFGISNIPMGETEL